jgi:hypothetical protein
MQNAEVRTHDDRSFSIMRWIGRMLITAAVLVVVSFLTPGFTINGIWSFLLAGRCYKHTRLRGRSDDEGGRFAIRQRF